MIENKDIKIGTQVRILKKNNSVNEVGDIGIITEIDCKDNDFRVLVDGRTTDCGTPNIGNWHYSGDVELVKMKATDEQLLKSKHNAEEDYMTTPISVLRYITELEMRLGIQDND
jgi:hypothetical protein